MTKEELRKEATFTIEWESTPMNGKPKYEVILKEVEEWK